MVKYSKLKRWIPECFYLSFHEVTDILKSNSRKNSMSLWLHRVFLYLLCFRDVQQLIISFFNHFIFQSGLSLLPSYSESCPCDMASKGCPSKLFIGCKLLLLCLDEFYISYYLSYPGQETPGASLVRFLPIIPGWKLVGNTLISSHNFFFFFQACKQKKELEEEKEACTLLQCLTNRQQNLCTVILSQQKSSISVYWWDGRIPPMNT